MIRSQRILIAVALPVFAFMLHGTLCEWGWKKVPARGRLIVGIHHPQAPQRYAAASGLFARGADARTDVAFLFGAVLPLALCAADAYLIRGWRHASAVRAGLCPQCGYNLKGIAGEKCPECGSARGD